MDIRSGAWLLAPEDESLESLEGSKDGIESATMVRYSRNTVFDNMAMVKSENEKYINQVNSVIRSYDHPIVNDFRIRYGLNRNHKHDIDDWIQFTVKMKVEFLELDLTYRCRYMSLYGEDYDFPSRFADVLPYLKKLILMRVNVTQEVFEALLKNSPHLEIITILLPPYC
ncbi:uncharacterized protein [Rutidosis leptorrhynchoides]|uniref:uncharacterized protein n=1 Tax=Rutidosis leptorrhynchoides TaxID=125765 RepID=UPI003A992E73